MKEALFYTKRDNSNVQCNLCPHNCVIAPGNTGKCCVRENHNGTLYTISYNKAITTAVDPIEKKPLYHFYPGSFSFSIATAGCNLSCSFCQNSTISNPTGPLPGSALSPQEVVSQAQEAGCRSIAYTYTEPTVFYEYALDIARHAHAQNLKNVFVTNGFTTPGAIDTISPLLDAANIDLKAYTDDFYRRYTGGRLQPVLDAIARYHRNGVFIEITTLLIPGKNDSAGELGEIASFIASLDRRIPWHISRFHPTYLMTDTPPTPSDTIHQALHIGKEKGLVHVYPGNIPSPDNEVTRCPSCGKIIIERSGFSVAEVHCSNGRCDFCNAEVNVVC